MQDLYLDSDKCHAHVALRNITLNALFSKMKFSFVVLFCHGFMLVLCVIMHLLDTGNQNPSVF